MPERQHGASGAEDERLVEVQPAHRPDGEERERERRGAGDRRPGAAPPRRRRDRGRAVRNHVAQSTRRYTGFVTADVLGTVRGVLFGLALLTGLGLSAAALARAFLAGARLSVRFCGFLLAAAWLATAAFHLLAAAGLFRLWAGLVLTAPGAAASVRWLRADPSRAEGLRADARALRAAILAAARSAPLLSGLAACLVIARLFRGLAAPPLAWDVLTYHLVKVARWVRTGALAPELAPDRWDGYEYFPYGGDALWAWAMLPFHSDAPLAAASVLVWLAALAAAWALARELGASGRFATAGALALLLNPASASFLASGYVENTSLFCFLAGSLFTVRVLKGDALPAEAALAAGAFALGAGVKTAGLPLLILALAVLAGALLARRPRPTAPAILLAGLAVLAGLPPYVRAFADRGSPVYPQALRVAGRTLLPGHPMTEQAVAGTLDLSMGAFDGKAFVRDLFVRRPDRDFLNSGWGGVALALLGAVGLVALARRGSPGLAVFLAAEAALTLALLFSPDALALRTWWAWIIGRFMLPALGVCAVLAAATNHAAVRAGFGFAALLGLWGALPHGFSREDFSAAAEVAGVLVAGAALAGIAASLARRRAGRAAGALAGTAVLLVAGAVWGAIRAQARPVIWRAAYERRAFELHPFVPAYGSAYSLWQALDDGASHRIAVSAGWYPPGDNWCRYPFFGRRLQNDVVYVPITSDGSLIDTRDAASSGRLSREAWVRRLVERGVDVVVLLAPEPPEAAWVRALPAAFEPFAVSSDGLNAAFRIRDPVAQAWLAQAPGSPAP